MQLGTPQSLTTVYMYVVYMYIVCVGTDTLYPPVPTNSSSLTGICWTRLQCLQMTPISVPSPPLWQLRISHCPTQHYSTVELLKRGHLSNEDTHICSVLKSEITFEKSNVQTLCLVKLSFVQT